MFSLCSSAAGVCKLAPQAPTPTDFQGSSTFPADGIAASRGATAVECPWMETADLATVGAQSVGLHPLRCRCLLVVDFLSLNFFVGPDRLLQVPRVSSRSFCRSSRFLLGRGVLSAPSSAAPSFFCTCVPRGSGDPGEAVATPQRRLGRCGARRARLAEFCCQLRAARSAGPEVRRAQAGKPAGPGVAPR